jgi:hypothetical protein
VEARARELEREELETKKKGLEEYQTRLRELEGDDQGSEAGERQKAERRLKEVVEGEVGLRLKLIQKEGDLQKEGGEGGEGEAESGRGSFGGRSTKGE